jgi:hypothetical protein
VLPEPVPVLPEPELPEPELPEPELPESVLPEPVLPEPVPVPSIVPMLLPGDVELPEVLLPVP